MKGKITVLKRLANHDLAREYRKEDYNQKYPLPCDAFEDGQEFNLENLTTIPDLFCTWAWADIHKEIVRILTGGNNGAIKQEGVGITCCHDGFRPVVFKIERME